MGSLSLDEINRLDIVDFLAGIGSHPQKISGNFCWYLSPLHHRREKTPSFKVDRAMNRWWDFSTAEGSTLVDFGIRYFDCTIRELKEKLSGPSLKIPSLNYPIVPHYYPIPISNEEHTIQVLHTYPVRSFYLLHYLWQRRIPVNVAQQYCVEVQFTFGPKPYYAIGFRCDAGGYELRSRYHSYNTLPQSPTLIRHQSRDIAVFDEFFDMLTFVSFSNTLASLPDLLILNSVSFFHSSIPVIAPYHFKHLFLHNNYVGNEHTKIAMATSSDCIDHRTLYTGYNDLNQWACNFGKGFARQLNDPGRSSP